MENLLVGYPVTVMIIDDHGKTVAYQGILRHTPGDTGDHFRVEIIQYDDTRLVSFNPMSSRLISVVQRDTDIKEMDNGS